MSWLIFLATLVLVSHVRQGLFLITVLTVVALMQVAILSFHKYGNLQNQNKSLQPELQGTFANKINLNTWLIFALCNLIVGLIMIILSVAYLMYYKCFGQDHRRLGVF